MKRTAKAAKAYSNKDLMNALARQARQAQEGDRDLIEFACRHAEQICTAHGFKFDPAFVQRWREAEDDVAFAKSVLGTVDRWKEQIRSADPGEMPEVKAAVAAVLAAASGELLDVKTLIELTRATRATYADEIVFVSPSGEHGAIDRDKLSVACRELSKRKDLTLRVGLAQPVSFRHKNVYEGKTHWGSPVGACIGGEFSRKPEGRPTFMLEFRWNGGKGQLRKPLGSAKDLSRAVIIHLAAERTAVA
jgi:hypothetical protein